MTSHMKVIAASDYMEFSIQMICTVLSSTEQWNLRLSVRYVHVLERRCYMITVNIGWSRVRNSALRYASFFRYFRCFCVTFHVKMPPWFYAIHSCLSTLVINMEAT